MNKRGKPEIYQYQTILASTRKGTELFDALEEMPTVMRATCVKALDHPEAATFVIADREGLAAWKAALEQNRREAAGVAAAQPAAAPARPERWKWTAGVGAGLLGALSLLAYWLLR